MSDVDMLDIFCSKNPFGSVYFSPPPSLPPIGHRKQTHSRTARNQQGSEEEGEGVCVCVCVRVCACVRGEVVGLVFKVGGVLVASGRKGTLRFFGNCQMCAANYVKMGAGRWAERETS